MKRENKNAVDVKKMSKLNLTISFLNNDMYLNYRCTQIKTYSWENAQVVLVGNKCDMDDERVVSCERGKQLADQLGI